MSAGKFPRGTSWRGEMSTFTIFSNEKKIKETYVRCSQHRGAMRVSYLCVSVSVKEKKNEQSKIHSLSSSDPPPKKRSRYVRSIRGCYHRHHHDDVRWAKFTQVLRVTILFHINQVQMLGRRIFSQEYCVVVSFFLSTTKTRRKRSRKTAQINSTSPIRQTCPVEERPNSGHKTANEQDFGVAGFHWKRIHFMMVHYG